MSRTKIVDEQDFKPKFKTSSEVLMNIFEGGDSPLSEQFIRWKLWAKWSDIVGQTMASNTEPVGYVRGCLYLWVKNSTWMQQLIFMRDPIKESINKKLGRYYVRSIRFTLDRHEVPDQSDQGFKEFIQKIAPENEDQE